MIIYKKRDTRSIFECYWRTDGRGDGRRRSIDGRVGQDGRASGRGFDIIQAVVGAVRRIVMMVVVADESVGVGVGRGGGRHRPFLVGVGLAFAVIVAQIVRLERLAERQLLRMPDAQLFAQRDDGVERLDAEIHPAVQVAQVGQLDAQGLVHRREMEQRIRLHSVLIQRRARPRQPNVARRPPERVIRPIGSDIYSNTQMKEFINRLE